MVSNITSNIKCFPYQGSPHLISSCALHWIDASVNIRLGGSDHNVIEAFFSSSQSMFDFNLSIIIVYWKFSSWIPRVSCYFLLQKLPNMKLLLASGLFQTGTNVKSMETAPGTGGSYHLKIYIFYISLKYVQEAL